MTRNALKKTPPEAESGRRERKRQRTKDLIAATAFRLFEAHGYEAITMEQVATEADVAKGTLYKYFPVKEALLAHQFRQEIAAGAAALQGEIARQPTFAARMSLLLHASAEWNKSRRAYLPHYLRFRLIDIDFGMRGPAPEELRSGSYAILEALIGAGQEEGAVRGDLPPGQLAWMFEFMCMGAVMVWLSQPKGGLRPKFDFALEVLLHGVAAPENKAKGRK